MSLATCHKLVAALLLLTVVGCTSAQCWQSGRPSATPGVFHHIAPVQPASHANWPERLPDLGRLHSASYTPGDLSHTGAEFDSATAQRVSLVPPGSARFAPNFTAPSDAANEPAWAVYQFNLQDFAGTAQLTLSCSQTGDTDELWLACADWSAGHWIFRRPSATGRVNFAEGEFAPLLEAGSGRFACAVIVLGQAEWVLDEVRLAGGSPGEYPNADCPLGVNLEGMADWMTSRVWVDAFKTAREWISQPSDGSSWSDGRSIPVDANGWPTSLAPDQYAGNVLITEQSGNYPTGEYICLYDGEGELHFGLDAQVVSAAPGRIVVQITPTSGGLTHLQIRQTNPADYIRNIRLLLPGYEATYTTQVFTPEFLVSCAPFKVLRFMDWMDTNGSTLTGWSGRATPEFFSQATSRGAAVEHMVELCNRLGADPWFCMGHLMTDDAVTQFATYIRDNLSPDLRVYVEHSNEVWNGQFPQAQYAQQEGLARGLSADPYQAQLFYHSLRSVELFALWEEVFGGTERLVRVLGSQAVNPWVSEQVASFQDAAAHADSIAIAPYFGFTVSEAEAAGVKAGGIAGIVTQWNANIAGQNASYLTAQKAVCDTYGLGLSAYEGGQHLVGLGNAVNDDELTLLLNSANRTPELRQLYLDYLNNWHTVSDGGIMLAFSHIGRYSKYGSWGLRESQAQDPAAAPKWQGCLDFLGP